ncbi:hypothetical protein L3Q82_016289 [Scortum barcoo]|uniref:Uncharacterized protein n=1 Tax=Scortum barcoo TaxID=214431 RepID=A0ACB8VQV6_9TELE|nr:hypothetical protein L3Q82_016289 [Scortum barcoo]
MGNYRTQLKVQGCPEVSINSLKSKATTDVFPTKKSKKSQNELKLTFYPSFPVGETQESLEKVRLELLKEIQKRNNEGVIADKMARTFAYRRQEVVNQEPLVQDFMERWSALFREKEINAEFQRLVALPLEQTFLAQLDKYSDQFIHIIQAKGGAKLYTHTRHLFQDNSAEDVQRDLEKLTTAVFVIRKEGEGLQEPPADIGIVIEGVEVLHDLTSVASACAHLLGLVYILILAYPKPLRFTFEVFQKVFMQLDPHKMSYKVQSLYGRLHILQ